MSILYARKESIARDMMLRAILSVYVDMPMLAFSRRATTCCAPARRERLCCCFRHTFVAIDRCHDYVTNIDVFSSSPCRHTCHDYADFDVTISPRWRHAISTLMPLHLIHYAYYFSPALMVFAAAIAAFRHDIFAPLFFADKRYAAI